jgi:tRNA(Ile)-lysidine synthase
LTRLGIDTKVLKIEWPKDLIPLQSSKFESLARQYRFRILGEACRDSNVRNLLLAHHRDDQYETIMMRLATGHRSRGLLGMKASGQIPECYGIYGVYGSGAVGEDFCRAPLSGLGIPKEQGKTLPLGDSTGMRQKPMDDKFHREPTQAEIRARRRQQRISRLPFLGRMRLEDGGIRLLRPLLQYSKERLIATCLQDGTPWFEDHTNADPTLTPRNAIRHVYKEHSIPAALQKDSIIALSAALKRKKVSLEREALSVLDHCSVRGFEPRAGSIFVRFPKLTPLESNAVGDEDKTTEEQNRREVACRLLKYAIEAVTPNEHIQYPHIEQVCSTVFPELNTANDQGNASPVAFTVAGVLFQRYELRISYRTESEDAASEVGSDKEAQQQSDTMHMQDYEWFLSRQPYESLPERQPVLEYPPLTFFKDENDGWKFYDGRYWIRVFNHTLTTIKVRPFRKEDLPAFRELKFKAYETFHHRLQTIARGEVRFTLPVIVLAAAGPSEKEKVLALPTLDVLVYDAEKFMNYEIRSSGLVFRR